MQLTAGSVVGFETRHRSFRYLLALTIVAVATLLRAAVDPLLHDQIPYFIYIASIVVATWFCGFDGGVLSTAVAAFAGNYFFVRPRYELIPQRDDWVAMGMFAGVSLGLVWLVGRWRRAERTARELHAQMQVATLAAEVGVWTWTPGTNRFSVSANWRGLFGVPWHADVTFETWADALHPDDRERAVATLNNAWRGRHEFATEYRVVRPDGTERWVIDRGRAFHDANGNAAGMAGVNIDITKRRAAEEALLDASRLKDEFLATLSHELRTPLNAIIGWSDLLRRGTLQAGQADRAMESVYRNAKTLSELIDDVLDVSRIVSGKVRIEMQPVDVVGVLNSALESVRSAADAKGVAILTEYASVPVPVSADPTRLQQVFWNLLTNAVKFTPAGGEVRISVGLSGDDVQVQVADTGIGINAEFLPHVFERFRQLDSSSTRVHGGLGLGLAIVRHLVELHGGTVQAESGGEGQGARFTVRLPAQPSDERRRGRRLVARPVRAADSAQDEAPVLSGARVLVVDDQREAREVAASVLRHHGASVAVAANAQEALDQFERFDPNVLLVDIAMPEIDGYGLIERIRSSNGEKGRSVPAIAFTAYAREEDQQRVRAAGFQVHLAKPVDSQSLVKAVAAVRAGQATS